MARGIWWPARTRGQAWPLESFKMREARAVITKRAHRAMAKASAGGEAHGQAQAPHWVVVFVKAQDPYGPNCTRSEAGRLSFYPAPNLGKLNKIYLVPQGKHPIKNAATAKCKMSSGIWWYSYSAKPVPGDWDLRLAATPLARAQPA